MKIRIVTAVAVAAICAAATEAAAQDARVLAKIRDLDAAAPAPSAQVIESAVMETAAAMTEAKGTCMPAAVTLEPATPITGARLILEGVLSGTLRNGWNVYAIYEGCEAEGDPVRRFALIEFADGTNRALPVNTGRSIANPSIMRDTSAAAAIGAMARVKREDSACDGSDLEMAGSRIVSESADLGPDVFGVRYTGSWREVWSFGVCGRVVDVPVEFTADGDGGAYTNVKADEIAVVN
ncbi:MAG: hypothetical protein V2I39_08700 [Erythrobacter sp.]|nr:hypothetical protein [Erythrobacter sp.]